MIIRHLLGKARWALLLGAVALSPRAHADDEYQKIIYVRVGDLAPAFTCRDDQGQMWNSSQHIGKRVVVLFFYMGDFFKPCTTEVCAFRNDLKKFVAQGVEVVGVSGDNAANHQFFKQKYKLGFRLLADTEGEVAKVFGVALSGGGVYRFKDREGKEIALQRGVTAARWTWVIGRDGRVLYKNTNANPAESSKEVLAFLAKQNKRK
jgi:peroxiredoxin Q/BCP